MNYLIDHTGFQALLLSEIPPESVGRKAHELLQLTELFLFADNVLLADRAEHPTLQTTAMAYDYLRKHGLTKESKGGIVQVVPLSSTQNRDACSRAAPLICEAVRALPEDTWRDIAAAQGMAIRPAGIPAIDLPSVIAIPYGSDQAEEFIRSAVERDDTWHMTAAVSLLDPSLYLWLQEICTHHPDRQDRLFSYLNTLFRWHINAQLARTVAEADSTPGYHVAYAPAVGRAAVLARYATRSWPTRLRLLERKLTPSVRSTVGQDAWNEFVSFLGPTIDAEIPLLGLWIWLELPESPTLDDLVAGIREARDHEYVTAVRAYLKDGESTDEDIEEVSKEVRRKLGLKVVARRRKLKHSISLLPPGIRITLPEETLSGEVFSDSRQELTLLCRRIRRRLMGSSEVTALLGIVRALESELSLRALVEDKLSSMIAAAVSEQNPGTDLPS